jgi:hypothetical protein
MVAVPVNGLASYTLTRTLPMPEKSLADLVCKGIGET